MAEVLKWPEIKCTYRWKCLCFDIVYVPVFSKTLPRLGLSPCRGGAALVPQWPPELCWLESCTFGRDTHAKQVEGRGQTKNLLALQFGGWAEGWQPFPVKKIELLQKPEALCATRHKEDRWRGRFPKTRVMFLISLRCFHFVPLFPNPPGRPSDYFKFAIFLLLFFLSF